MGTIKGYYKAVTTTKRFIVIEDLSTNFTCYTYTATNNITKWENSSYDTKIIDCEYYYENLDILKSLFNDLVSSWSQNCYYYEWAQFLKEYELSNNQYMIIKRLVDK